MDGGAYALSGGAVGGASVVADGKVAALAALDDLKLGAGLGGDGGGDGGAEAVALQQSRRNCQRFISLQERFKRFPHMVQSQQY